LAFIIEKRGIFQFCHNKKPVALFSSFSSAMVEEDKGVTGIMLKNIATAAAILATCALAACEPPPPPGGMGGHGLGGGRHGGYGDHDRQGQNYGNYGNQQGGRQSGPYAGGGGGGGGY
jgi:hypothetical protein